MKTWRYFWRSILLGRSRMLTLLNHYEQAVNACDREILRYMNGHPLSVEAMKTVATLERERNRYRRGFERIISKL